MLRGFEPVAKEFQKFPSVVTVMPSRGTAKSAGYDFTVKEDITIPPQTTMVIATDVKAKMMPDEVLLLHIRSSLGIKKKLILSNCTGVIDADYYNNPDTGGNIMGALYNYGNAPVTIKAGEYFMQGIFQDYKKVTNDQPRKQERVGGIGSTGV